MSRLLNQERTMRGQRPEAAPPEPAGAAAPATPPAADTPAPTDLTNRLAPLPPTRDAASASVVRAQPRRHPFKRGLLFAVLFGAPLAWYGWAHRPPDPWLSLLEGPVSPAVLSPAIAAMATIPAAERPAAPPLPPAPLASGEEPLYEPLPFAEERLNAAFHIPEDLAIEVRTGRPPQLVELPPPEDPLVLQAVDALLQLEDALGTAAELSAPPSSSL